MVRSASLRVSNHEAERTAILRDARKGALLRMRTGSPFKPTDRQIRIGALGLASEFQKFRLTTDPNHFHIHHCPVPSEGRWPTSSTWGGMRWTRFGSVV